MATALQQLLYLFEDVDESNIVAELRRLRDRGDVAQAKALFLQSMTEDDVFPLTEVLRAFVDLPQDAREMLFTADEYLEILQSLDVRSTSYTDRTIYLSLLVDTIRDTEVVTRQYALALVTKYFEALLDRPQDETLLELLSLYAELAYNVIITLTTFYDLALMGSDDNLVTLVYTAAHQLAELMAKRFFKEIGCKCAALLPLAASLFTVFSAAQVSNKEHCAYGLLCYLVQLLTTGEPRIATAVLASALKIVKEDGYACIEVSTSPKRSGFILMCHTLLGAGANITAGIELLCNKLGVTEYEEQRVEVLCIFFGMCADSDVRVAKLMGKSRFLAKWMNSKIGSVEPSDHAAVTELAEKLLALNAVDEELVDSMRQLSQGLRYCAVAGPLSTEVH